MSGSEFTVCIVVFKPCQLGVPGTRLTGLVVVLQTFAQPAFRPHDLILPLQCLPFPDPFYNFCPVVDPQGLRLIMCQGRVIRTIAVDLNVTLIVGIGVVVQALQEEFILLNKSLTHLLDKPNVLQEELLDDKINPHAGTVVLLCDPLRDVLLDFFCNVPHEVQRILFPLLCLLLEVPVEL